MLDENVFSIVLSPIGVMLASAVAIGVASVKSWQAGSAVKQPDALAALFKGDTLQDQASDPRLRQIRARGLIRAAQARGREVNGERERERKLREVAAVLRGSERDPGIVQAATRFLQGEGFIILDQAPEPDSTEVAETVAEIGTEEEVKLLAPPSPGQASQAA